MSKVALRILIVAAALTLLVVYAGAATGEWRGALVTEVHVLIVAYFAYLCLRPQALSGPPLPGSGRQRGRRT